jgi:tRNA threonylcarbamoyladenosine modification (KEOPS) complex Cgi121 subunit
MAPLNVQEVLIADTTHQVGIFGCRRATPLMPDDVTAVTHPVTSLHGLTLLLVDADFVAGADHLLFATIHALSAFHQQTNRASTREMEILRFAAAERQISHALSLLGVSESTRRFGGVLLNSSSTILDSAYLEFLNRVEATDDASVLELTTPAKAQVIQKMFQITKAELDAICPSRKPNDRRLALQKLVYDRCALLAITR